jgi:DNA-binding CsgD family transcriptional regulator
MSGRRVEPGRLTKVAARLAVEPVTIRRRAKKPIIARIHPVPDAARSPFLGARAMVIFSSLAPKPPLSTNLLAGLFGLSPAEARLASIMAAGIDLQTAAEEMGVARDTARNQIKAIFAKTGERRQSELAELLAKLADVTALIARSHHRCSRAAAAARPCQRARPRRRPIP